MSTTAFDAPKILREVLEQTLEEKRQVDLKYAEDCQRIEQKLAEVKSIILTYTSEFQSLGYTALTVQPDVGPQVDTPHTHKPVLSSRMTEDVRRLVQERIPTQSDSFSINLSGKWKLVWYVVGTILMFVVLFFLASLFEKPKETSQVFPSLVNSAEACVIADRIRERVQERRDTVDSFENAPEEQEICEVECAEESESGKTVQKRPPRQPVRTLFRSMRR